MHAKKNTPSLLISPLNRFIPGSNARQNIFGPMPPSPCCTPLEQVIVLVSPESTRKNASPGLVPKHLATNGLSAGMQLTASASTAVLLTVRKASEQSVITRQLTV